jgi:hypothetical protein
MTSHNDNIALLKLAAIWLATLVSSVSLQHVLMGVTIVYTLAQLYVLWRDKIRRQPKKDA